VLTERLSATRVDTGGDRSDLEADFAAIFVALWPRVYAYVWLMLRQREDAEDLASETFERAYEAWAGGHPPRGEALPWLLLIARRLVIDRSRRRRILAWIPLFSIREPAVVDQAFERSESWVWFEHLRGTVAPRQFEALVLRYQFDLGNSEIGRLMGLSEAGVRTLISRAIAVLRRNPEVLGHD
jgi:RNA polymerase sigma-70 factor (ECF subfamily)